eukprot:TRINITY_DN9844_c0_g1_i1.p1 TRINITY_DN9844_c0_g1~~TRINITY_DN9844_c0_g1_i1.p1  ORF type:complete len:486 (+),score=240.86 TRINITY_DN9844_c0_g1_i1:55-1458(+)
MSSVIKRSAQLIIDNPYTREASERITLASTKSLSVSLDQSSAAQNTWRGVPLADRIALGQKFISSFLGKKDSIAQDLTKQIGKPIQQSHNEINTTVDRAQTILRLAPSVLSDDILSDKGNVSRKVTKEPVGTVMVISPWNYPLLCGINAILPAVLAGNSVLLKPAFRASKTGQHFETAFAEAGFPKHLVSAIYPDDDHLSSLLASKKFGAISFTGSTGVGKKVATNVAPHFSNLVLELSSKDGSYVAPDADLAYAIDSLVDGVAYNAGQSCCGVKRIFVHESVYDKFVEGATALFDKYVYGDPMSPEVTIGPIANESGYATLLNTVRKSLTGAVVTTTKQKGLPGRYFAPTLIKDLTGESYAMTADYFGPMVVVTPVKTDEEAVARINNSDYGLTASIYTNDQARAARIAPLLNVGTVYVNRCDYLDPELPWSGRKQSGNGKSLGTYGFGAYFTTKSYNVRDLSKTQ